MNAPRDTIAAVASPPGRGGIGIVRISGAGAAGIAEALTGPLPPPRHAAFRRFRGADGEPIDEGILLYFPAPASFTGEDVVELQGHGGPVIMDLLLTRVLQVGARSARPGEFSERAFLNDRLDLAQAEAVADLIDAVTAEAARSARRTLAGEFSRAVNALAEDTAALRTYVEAALDFPDEEIDFLADGDVSARVASLRERLAGVLDTARQGRLLRDGLTVVIAGRPNVGKSSLLNRLSGTDTAIVTEVPGTTRDLLRERIHLDGIPLHVVDTAGLRESKDRVERVGVERAWDAIAEADAALLVVDDTRGCGEEEQRIRQAIPEDIPVITVYNKVDLSGAAPGGTAEQVRVSALTGAGFDSLRGALKRAAGYHPTEGGVVMARRRHLEALATAARALAEAARQTDANHAGELVAEELRRAHHALGEITGVFTTEDLLGRIFASFCIGK